LTGGFKGVRRREWSKNKIKIFNKKTLPPCLLFQGHVTGTAPFLGLTGVVCQLWNTNDFIKRKNSSSTKRKLIIK
jgi:hypothetical protein